jgi:hypothetical protein
LNTLRAGTLCVLIACILLTSAGKAYSGIGTTVPVSAELATSIAGNLFPVTVKLNTGNLFLTDPIVLFFDDRRIGVQVRFHAYDHRPEEGIAISEMGRALISGELDYDPGARQILLHDPRIDNIEFDRDSGVTQRIFTELKATWTAQVTNPIRSEIPPHPYLLPFKENIQDLSCDGKNINLEILYE